MLAPWKKSYDKPKLYFQKQRHNFADKGDTLFDKVKAMVFPVVIYGCDYKES